MTIAKLKAFVLAAVVSAALTPVIPTSAVASPVSDAFLVNVGANLGFLTRSSRLMAEKSASAAMRTFARNEVAEQVRIAEALIRVAPALSVASAETAVATGRSVAVDGDPASDRPAAAQTAANGRVALGDADLAELRHVSGRALDDLYWQKQLDALSQLESDYRTYIAHGDDPALVAIAKADLPRVMKRLEALTKV